MSARADALPKNARLLFVHALSPLHAGTGQGIGVIDLPIARERATGLPFLPGSSIKGTLRDVCKTAGNRHCVPIFGPETENAADHAGAAQFADARLLLLPVRSLVGTFAWVTSPYILRRFVRDARETAVQDVPAAIPDPPPPDDPDGAAQCLVADQHCAITYAPPQLRTPQVFLEDLDLPATGNPTVTSWAVWLAAQVFPGTDTATAAWRTHLAGRLCVVNDNVLTFLLNTATEVTARIRLNPDTKTVDSATGALWYEEALPTETILAGLVVATPNGKTGLTGPQIFTEIADLTDRTLQFGGKATVGRGLCRTTLAPQ